MKRITDSVVKAVFPKRQKEGYKYTFGKVLSICGSKKMMGASILAAKGIMACGAGHLTIAVPKTEKDLIISQIPEAIALTLNTGEEAATLKEFISVYNPSVVVIGPGLGLAPFAMSVINYLDSKNIPFVLDADGLSILAQTPFKPFSAPSVITPHMGEAAKLLGRAVAVHQRAREEAALELSEKTGGVCVLKGHNTVIAYKGKLFLNETGNSGLAKAGTGDVLAGMTASIWAQMITHAKAGPSSLPAACCGVFLHGLAADIAARDLTEYSITASLLINYIPKAIKEIL
ncbi:NAD(P)H-hydrate epimerase [Parelusimicrobium proximum]|uniref:NAD(P)H-hydrate dehydratase n=1 Tax=Parelusimicrobium proximum TaxID=3228953 RepID=UPI003D185553